MKLKTTLNSLFVLCLVSFSMISAASAPVKNTDANAANIYTEDKQNILVTSEHPQFTIKIKSNPTTGFSWFLREYDVNLITPVKHAFQKPTNQLVGAPGYELWTFRIKPAGFVVPQQTTIRLIYTRPWQSADSANQLVFRVTTQK